MRNDEHRPAVIDPANYDYVGVFYQGPVYGEEHADQVSCYMEQDSVEAVEAARELLEANPFDGNHKNRSTCDHCGAAFRYGVVYKHAPTGEGIAVGQICSQKTFGFDSRRDLELARLRERAAAARERQKARKAAAEFLAAHEGLEEILAQDHYLLTSFREQLWAKGQLSERQLEVTYKIGIEEPKEEEPKEEEQPSPVVEGRIELAGQILGIKEQVGAYGVTDKMLFVDDRGFKVWVTIPESLWELGREGAERDGVAGGGARAWLLKRRVAFTATVEASKKDKTFGFGKRPTKPKLL